MANILYIDNDAIMTEVMLHGFKEDGTHQVKYVKSPDEAADIIKSGEHFALVILDIMMRKGNLTAKPGETQTGFILHRLIRERWTYVPIIVLSVFNQNKASEAMRKDGNLTWLRKPILMEELLAKITEVL